MITFVLNDKEVISESPPGTPLLEVIRNEYRLKGTKLACGEGECGACTVLIGSVAPDGMQYLSVTSCITPVMHAEGKHVVTIEGLNTPLPGLVQYAMIACNGTQCGFCTPGFVVAMSGCLIGKEQVTKEELITAIDGNICRCTGYKSIERAAEVVVEMFNKTKGQRQAHFGPIRERLIALHQRQSSTPDASGVVIGGGTDLYVQQPHGLRTSHLRPATALALQGITKHAERITLGAAETMHGIMHSAILERILPGIKSYLSPVASTQIRNTATLGGNLVNASPIGDLTILFLALDADVVFSDDAGEHKIKLRDFYTGYKTLAKSARAIVTHLEFEFPPMAGFHFERVCKRNYLDVASVNSACLLECDTKGVIKTIHLSAGGVAPIPKYLQHTVDFLTGKAISTDLILHAEQIMQKEIAPISDIRGSEEYKRLLLRQLFFMHMTKLSPVSIDIHALLRK